MATITATPTIATAGHRHPVRRAALVSGAVAATATTAMGAVADAAGVPLAVDDATIPLLGFAQMTLVGVLLGGLIAAAVDRSTARPHRWFVPIATVLTALSCIPSITMPPDVATKLVLVATHVAAAVIVVPALARQIRS